MELHGHFRYGGGDSKDYGVALAHVETKHDNRVSGGIETVNVFTKCAKRNYFTRDDYSDSPISFDVEFISDDDEKFSINEQRAIKKWLFYRQGYLPLYIDEYDDCENENTEIVDGVEKRIYLRCRFTNPEAIYGNGGVVGFKATLEADSPFAWQEKTETTVTFNGGSSMNDVFAVEIDTDLNDFTYPKVTITTGNTGGDVTITNNTDDPARLTTFEGLSANTAVIMNEEIGQISGQNYMKFSNKNFIRLLDGVNNLSVIGDVVSIKFEWQNRRYL